MLRPVAAPNMRDYWIQAEIINTNINTFTLVFSTKSNRNGPSAISPPGSFLAPGEQVLLYLPKVQLQRADRSLIGGKDLSYSSDKTTLHLESGRPTVCDFGVTNYRAFANTPKVVRISSSGLPLPSYDWIYDLGFAYRAIAERQWVKAEATKSALGATAAFYKVSLTRKIDPSTTGFGSQYLHIFLDAVSLIGSGVRMGPATFGIPFTKHEAGIAIKA